MMKKLNSLKSLNFLESFKSIKLPESLQSLKSKSPKIEFDKTKAAKAASSVVLFGFSGWFLWQTFLVAPEPTLPPSLPQAVATINPAPVTQAPPPVADPIEAEEHLAVADQNEMNNALWPVGDLQTQSDETQNQMLQDEQQASTEMHASVDPQLSELVETTENITDETMPDIATTTEHYVDEPTPDIATSTEHFVDEPTPDIAISTEHYIDEPTPDITTATEHHVDEPTPDTTTVANSPIVDDVPKEGHQYALTARSNLDARECLDLADSMAIHRCAENFR